MKKTSLILGIALSSMVLFSCGGSKTENTLKPETTTISGDLEDAYVVVEKNYEPVKDRLTVVTIEVERTDADLPFDLETMNVTPYGYTSGDAHAGFGIEFLDDDGNILDEKPANDGGVGGAYSSDDIKNLIKLKPGEKSSIRFTIEDKAENATQFRMTSAYDEL